MFKAQINFDLTLFKFQIDVDSLEKWLNILEGYYHAQKNVKIEMIMFSLLKSLSHVRWEGYWET